MGMRLAIVLVVACGGSSDAPPASGSGSAPPPPPPDSMPVDAAAIDAVAAAPPDAAAPITVGHGTGTTSDLIQGVSVQVDCTRVDGGDIEVGQRIVRTRIGVFRQCFQKELAHGAHDGASDVSFAVKDGHPDSVTIAGTVPSDAVASCTRAEIVKTTFPKGITALRCAITYKR